MVNQKNFEIPDQGALAYLTFDDTEGHEQKGRRPVFVLSIKEANRHTGMVLCLPITSHVKGYAQEVILPDGLPVTGAILLAQARSFDFKARNLRIVGYAPEDFIEEVVATFSAIVGR